MTADFSGGHLSSDGGLVFIREMEMKRGTLGRLAGCFTDLREQVFVEHSVEELLRQRIGALALGYEDLIDHERLRHDPLCALMAGNPGEGLKQLPDHIRPRSGYSGAYGRLTEDMVASTITRWVFHPGSGRWGHPRDIRVLTIREAARIQGFPDDFEFVGTYNNQAGQVGNAVPPLLARRIAEEVWHQLAESRHSSSVMSSASESRSDGAGRLNVIA